MSDRWHHVPTPPKIDYPDCPPPDLEMPYPKDWHTIHHQGRVTVALTPPRYGCVDLAILPTGGSPIVLKLSYVYDPFERLAAWLLAVAERRLPTWMEIDEEGVTKRLLARSSTEDDSLIEFRIEGHCWDERRRQSHWENYLWLRVHHGQFIREFSRRLSEWLAGDYRADQWSRYGIDEGEKSRWIDVPALSEWDKLTALAASLPPPPPQWL